MGGDKKNHTNKKFPPIDIVYTWVDGNDPKWLTNKKKYVSQRKKKAKLDQSSHEKCRYQNIDELKYSLRSVFKFATFVRKIFIVTAGQTPSWFEQELNRNKQASKIKIISHETIFPKPLEKYLPTFNSIAIEMNLHRIPDLAEHFIYMNDDVFFGRKVYPEHFITLSGKPKVFLRDKYLQSRSAKLDPKRYNYRDSMYATHLFMNQYVKPKSKRLTVHHVGYLMKKKILNELEILLRKAGRWDQSVTRFRQNQNLNLVPFLYPHYSLEKNYAIVSKGIIAISVSSSHHEYYDKIQKIKPHLYCLNNLKYKTPSLKRFWNQYY